MYVPSHFALTDEREIREIMRSSSFATLVSSSDGVPIAAHLPVEIADPDGVGEKGGVVVIGHMARANPLWRGAQRAAEVLVIFLGPHAYVSPRWYESPSVPTWNYSAVHLYGRFRLVEEQDQLYGILRRLVARHEASNGSPEPFDLEDLPRQQVEGMMQAIVGFEILPTRIEAVAKLSQNRGAADRKRVVDELASRSDDASRRVAGAMARIDAARSRASDT